MTTHYRREVAAHVEGKAPRTGHDGHYSPAAKAISFDEVCNVTRIEAPAKRRLLGVSRSSLKAGPIRRSTPPEPQGVGLDCGRFRRDALAARNLPSLLRLEEPQVATAEQAKWQ